MQYELLNAYSVFLFLNTFFAFSLAVYTLTRRRSTTGEHGAAVFLVGAGIWSAADAMKIAAPRGDIILWNRVSYVGVVMIPPAAIWFIAAYTDRDRWLQWDRFLPILGTSAVALFAVATNHAYGLWRAGEKLSPASGPPVLDETFGRVHYAWNIYVLFIVVPLIYVLLVRKYRSSTSSLFRRQVLLLATSFVAPFIAASLYVFGWTQIDYSPFAFTLFGLSIVIAIKNYRLFDIVPIARNTVVETIDSGVLVIDQTNQIVDINSRGAAIVGADKQELIGRRVDAVLEDFPGLREAVQTIQSGEQTVSTSFDGEQRFYRASFSEITETTGDPLGRVVLFNDVTEQEQRKRQLAEQTDMLERKNERLDEFASIVSHDLRNPLNVAQLWTETLHEEIDHEAVEKIDSSLGRMESIITDVLTLARHEERIEQTETVSLADTARAAWGHIQAESATLTVEDDRTVQADESRLQQLFENLFRNALEHGGEEVTVTVEPTDEGFAVADNGPGIHPTDREQVFESGYTTSESGIGLGLSIVETIVEAHGWSIAITDSESGGARFEIVLDDTVE